MSSSPLPTIPTSPSPNLLSHPTNLLIILCIVIIIIVIIISSTRRAILSVYLFISLHLNRLVVIPMMRDAGDSTGRFSLGSFLSSLFAWNDSTTPNVHLFSSFWSYARMRRAFLRELRDDTRSATVRVPVMAPLFAVVRDIRLERRDVTESRHEGWYDEEGSEDSLQGSTREEYRVVAKVDVLVRSGEEVRIMHCWNRDEDALNEMLIWQKESVMRRDIMSGEKIVTARGVQQQNAASENLLHDEDASETPVSEVDSPLTPHEAWSPSSKPVQKKRAAASTTTQLTVEYTTKWVSKAQLKCFPQVERVIKRTASGSLKLIKSKRPRAQQTQGGTRRRRVAATSNSETNATNEGEVRTTDESPATTIDDTSKHVSIPLLIYCERVNNSQGNITSEWDSEASRAYFVIEFTLDSPNDNAGTSGSTSPTTTTTQTSPPPASTKTFFPRIYKTLYQNDQLEVFTVNEVYTSEDDDCVVCLSEEPSVILLPCRHQCVCYECFSQIDKCPVCRCSVQHFIFSANQKAASLGDETDV